MYKKNNLVLTFVLSIFLLTFISGAIQTLEGAKVGEEINIIQSCASCSFNNISAILYPNNSFIFQEEIEMDNNGASFNYTLNSNFIPVTGSYIVEGHGDLGGVDTDWTYNIIVTTNGENVDLSNGIVLFGQIFVMFLFFGIGRVWKEKKWKLKMFFDILSLLMAVVVLNSIRLIATQSEKLSTMGDMGLIIGITLVSIMIAYFLVLVTIETLQHFKKKESEKWEMRDYEN